MIPLLNVLGGPQAMLAIAAFGSGFLLGSLSLWLLRKVFYSPSPVPCDSTGHFFRVGAEPSVAEAAVC